MSQPLVTAKCSCCPGLLVPFSPCRQAALRVLRLTQTRASPQAATGVPVSQISDGQVQATSAAPATYTGAAVAHQAPAGFFVAGLAGALALL